MRIVLLLCCFKVYELTNPEYWKGKISTHFNGTMREATPIYIESSDRQFYHYNSEVDQKVTTSLNGKESDHPLSSGNPSNVPPHNRTGKFHKITLVNGYILSLAVLDEFNFDGNKTIPVKLSTSWLTQVGNDTRPGELSEAVQNGNLLNISMKLSWKRFSENITMRLNENRFWELDDYLCYYQGSKTQVIDNKCVIPYTEIIKYYEALWTVPSMNQLANGRRSRVSNFQTLVEEPPCFDNGKYGQRSYMDIVREYERQVAAGSKDAVKPRPCQVFEKVVFIDDNDEILVQPYAWYMFETQPVATGWSVNTSFGYNNTRHSFDLNFTILFNNWTFDFPNGLMENYRDGSFVYENFEIEIWFWNEDPIPKPERDVPMEYFFMIIVMLVCVCNLLLVLFFRVVTGSPHAFSMDVWIYRKSLRTRKVLSLEEKRRLKREKSLKEASEYIAKMMNPNIEFV